MKTCLGNGSQKCCGYFRHGHKQRCMNSETAKCIVEGLKERSPSLFFDFMSESFGIFSFSEVLDLVRGLNIEIDIGYLREAFPDQDVCYMTSIVGDDLRDHLRNFNIDDYVERLIKIRYDWDEENLFKLCADNFFETGMKSPCAIEFVDFIGKCLELSSKETEIILKNILYPTKRKYSVFNKHNELHGLE